MEINGTTEALADLLHSIGWRSTCDAQWHQLDQSLPLIAAMVGPLDLDLREATTWRDKGYNGDPLPAGATEGQRRAWEAGMRAPGAAPTRRTNEAEFEQAGVDRMFDEAVAEANSLGKPVTIEALVEDGYLVRPPARLSPSLHMQRIGRGLRVPPNMATVLDRMEAMLAPANKLLAVPYGSATVEAARMDIEIVRRALAGVGVPLMPSTDQAQFLIDRLDDFEQRITHDEDRREWFGHVVPALARFRAALVPRLAEALAGDLARPMVDIVPPATHRDRWMFEQGRLSERDPRTPVTNANEVRELAGHVRQQAGGECMASTVLVEYAALLDAQAVATVADEPRSIGEIVLDAKGHPFARLRTAFDDRGEALVEGAKIYTRPAPVQDVAPTDAEIQALSAMFDGLTSEAARTWAFPKIVPFTRAALARWGAAPVQVPDEAWQAVDAPIDYQVPAAGSYSTGMRERDPSLPAEAQGLFRKYHCARLDGADQPGGKHHGCDLFVLDLTHDLHARRAVVAYALSCYLDIPMLSADLLEKWGGNQAQTEATMFWSTDHSGHTASSLEEIVDTHFANGAMPGEEIEVLMAKRLPTARIRLLAPEADGVMGYEVLTNNVHARPAGDVRPEWSPVAFVERSAHDVRGARLYREGLELPAGTDLYVRTADLDAANLAAAIEDAAP